ncbi:MAG: hypothetical protein WBM61_16270, partial [Woeseiaceae bacterium]
WQKIASSDCLFSLFCYYAICPLQAQPSLGSTEERKQNMAPTVACPSSAEIDETTGKLPPSVSVH